ncbi:hypothetical protein D3C83_150660 [compost metagenome]
MVLAEAEILVHRGARVDAADPLAGGFPHEFGGLRRLLEGFASAEDGRDVHAVEGLRGLDFVHCRLPSSFLFVCPC